MTQEEKAKAYDEAIERAKSKIKNDKDHILYEDDVIEIFPELKESEDERIRKGLINMLSQDKDLHSKEIAWLEKQKPIELDKDAEIRFRSILNLIDNGCPIEKSYIDFIKSVYAMLMESQQQKKCDEKNWFEKQGEQKPVEWDYPYGENETVDKLMAIAECLEMDEDFMYNGYTSTECVKFLRDLARKQVECKPVDKVEPKFKVGDWAVCNNGLHPIFQVIEYSWPDAKYRDINGTEIFLNVNTLDKQYHLWTIQDAKDGDVVVNKSDGTIGMFQSIGHHPDGGSYNDPSYCFLHCRYDDGFFYADFENGNTMDSYDAIPATKEQRELLFQKMKEEGYEWDAEKKELKKIEQTSWNEYDEEKFRDVIRLVEQGAPTHPIRNHYINWLKSFKDRVQLHLKQTQQKEEWSEEDELNLNSFLHKLEVCDLLSNKEITWIKNKLKSIKHWKPSEK